MWSTMSHVLHVVCDAVLGYLVVGPGTRHDTESQKGPIPVHFYPHAVH